MKLFPHAVLSSVLATESDAALQKEIFDYFAANEGTQAVRGLECDKAALPAPWEENDQYPTHGFK